MVFEYLSWFNEWYFNHIVLNSGYIFLFGVVVAILSAIVKHVLDKKKEKRLYQRIYDEIAGDLLRSRELERVKRADAEDELG